VLAEPRLSFFLFVLTGFCDEEHVLSLSVVEEEEEEVCRKREKSNVARFFYLRFIFSRAKRCFCADSKAMMTQYSRTTPLKLQGVFDYSKCSEPKNAHIRDTFFSLIRSLTQYFLHTHKNTHTDAHRKHSLS